MRRLWYKSSAKCWNEALPIGNGRIGAMVYGEALNDRVQLNEETLWSGYPKEDNTLFDAEFMSGVRALAKDRKYAELYDSLKSVFTGSETAAYVPFGYLNIDIVAERGEITDYERELSLENATATTSFSLSGSRVEKTAFVSLADDVMVYRIKSEMPVTVRVASVCELEHSLSFKNGTVKTLGRCPTCVSVYHKEVEYDDKKESIPFCAMIKAMPVSGDVTVYGGSSLNVRGSDFMLVFSIKTGFNGYDKMPITQGKEYKKACKDTLEKACSYTYGELFARHEAEYKRYFDRVSFTLDGEDFDEPTDERIKKAADGRVDNKLVTLLFDYSRLLTICGNARGEQATNLQGIWNDDITPSWRCNYTVNINTQMNYWPTNAFDLPEMQEPLFRLIRELKEKGNHFGLRGWALFHNTDIWRDNGLKSTVPVCGWSVTCGAWLCRHIWEHYLHTRDLEFLRENYDIFEGQAGFFIDYMTESDGELIVSPSAAPENFFMFDGKKVGVAEWTAFDQEVCIDFFDFTVKAGELLGKDCTLYRETLRKIKRPTIASDGRLMEWNEEFTEEDKGHRHISHLYGFYPADSLTGDEYKEAVKKSLATRVEHGDSYFNCGQLGWSCVWIGCVYARLGDSERFYEQIRKYFRNCLYDNMLSVCCVFQIEAAYGIASAIIEALVQSHGDKVVTMPAIPKEWKHGEVKGLVVRTGEKISFSW